MVRKLASQTLVLMVCLVLLWGASWPIYKLAIPYTPPLLFAGMRSLFGGLLLGLLIWKSYGAIRWRENWQVYVISAFFNSILFFALQSIGLDYLPGGLFSVLVYIQPIMLTIFAWLFLREAVSLPQLAGLILGFIGIALASVDALQVSFSAIGLVLALLTGISWAYGVIYIKQVKDRVDAFWLVAIQSVIGGSFLLMAGLIFEDPSAIVWNPAYMLGLFYGMTFGIPLAYLIYYHLVNRGKASQVASVTFLIPIISVLISVLFLKEPLTLTLLVGMSFVGISIYVVNHEKYQVKT